jgi:hypothetical protein
LNCGACGNVCSGGHYCENSACVCPQGKTGCGTECVDTTSDSSNCGACGNACGAGLECFDSHCFCSDAGDLPCNGQCVDVASDRSNCGGCGNVCPAGQDCVHGDCQSTRCPSPTTDCDGVMCCPETMLCVHNEYTGAPFCCTPGFGRHEDCVRLGQPLICCMPQ